jgi:mRNA interferase YafQ
VRTLRETHQFIRDKRRLKRSGQHDWQRMIAVVTDLLLDQPLARHQRDHALTGDYRGARECHVAPDWLLVYSRQGPVDGGDLTLIRTGSHSELF